MATHHTERNKESQTNKNEAGLPEQTKADALPAGKLDEATEERLQNEVEDAGTTHPNRGHNKPDNGKGSYA
ncbi:hypothetical protein GCM10023172_22010 [Hymenobacter ginsengisoli]|uniref:Uncharacterized protein n=1 Tax=Hymenobacter ginsengisoli TaxID=1051626 RepID=A0ABP8QEZ4_9BACT|nr:MULTISPECIES: hypothetical protein [unclassified Hymenobacter]MBO2032034.1 hypothetical protein [Hymenobacter sp. BT559]